MEMVVKAARSFIVLTGNVQPHPQTVLPIEAGIALQLGNVTLRRERLYTFRFSELGVTIACGITQSPTRHQNEGLMDMNRCTRFFQRFRNPHIIGKRAATTIL